MPEDLSLPNEIEKTKPYKRLMPEMSSSEGKGEALAERPVRRQPERDVVSVGTEPANPPRFRVVLRTGPELGGQRVIEESPDMAPCAGRKEGK